MMQNMELLFNLLQNEGLVFELQIGNVRGMKCYTEEEHHFNLLFKQNKVKMLG